ncbi:MAG: transcription-repair coupling factor, partial [Deltaproteobacteria bacterium]|nr:transcription-repair coupling factor [Deltaproteobacteria bacterium]
MMSKNRYLDELKGYLEKEDRHSVSVTGLSGAARSYFLSQLLIEIERPSVVILPSARDAAKIYREMEFFLPETWANGGPGGRKLYDFPIYDISPMAGLSPHRNLINRRLQALFALTSEENPLIITSMEAILFRIIPKKSLLNFIEYFETGEDISREVIVSKLEIGGYQRTSLVEERGDYSVRGGVIDIFPPLYHLPVRLEFWGDRLESMRYFDSLTQRSTEHLKEMILLPSSEIILDKDAVKRSRSMGRLPGSPYEGPTFPGQEAWLNHFYHQLDTLFTYIPPKGLVILPDPARMKTEKEKFHLRILMEMEKHRQEATEQGKPFPDTTGIVLSNEDVDSLIEKYRRIEFRDLAVEKGGSGIGNVNIPGVSDIDDDLEIRFAGKGRVSMAPLAEKIFRWISIGGHIVLVCRTEQQAGRLKEILNNYDVKVEEISENWSRVSAPKGVSICLGRLSKGFSWPEAGIYVVSEDEIFGPKRAGAKSIKVRDGEGLDWTSFSQLKVNDLVVHEDHGIGRYGGLIRMDIEGKINDFIVIDYADNDRLYTPADRISVLQKYIGADESNPRLDRLGGRSWDIAKKKAKRSVMEIAKHLVEIYAVRKYRDGFAFSRPDNYFREFEASFEHEETPDQIKAIDDVLTDMESDRPMDRLICGDVGFGKTEVAIRAAFKAVQDGKQVAMLVPTTVLAEQHYETFKKRMDPYQLEIAVLSRFKTRAEQKEILAKIRSGKIDVIIGTHRLLQKDVAFKDLGLLIIDEEQRFGVNQKEKLKKYRTLVDVLALTATPIPRSLHMSMMGIRDLSIINTPPEDRLAIQTHLSTYNDATIKGAIEDEIERGGQVFFVHNRVKDIDEIAVRLRELVPTARFAVAHGQMKERNLEETMLRFLKREADVLICTTIIESGLDIPSSNTIIINEVDRFGLAQIYQLRGRVGRSSENAY